MCPITAAARISLILNSSRAITADTALRRGAYFGLSPELWLNLVAAVLFLANFVMTDTDNLLKGVWNVSPQTFADLGSNITARSH